MQRLTALHLAVVNDQVDVAELLINAIECDPAATFSMASSAIRAHRFYRRPGIPPETRLRLGPKLVGLCPRHRFFRSYVSSEYVSVGMYRKATESFEIGVGLLPVNAEARRISDVVHEGVQCHVCKQEPIPGCRYKCLACSDYDICGHCCTASLGIINFLRFQVRNGRQYMFTGDVIIASISQLCFSQSSSNQIFITLTYLSAIP